jgi:glycosyltransferase involved in cell wall biosynthesis
MSDPASSARRPDVALFLPSLAGGGAERVMLDLAGAFADTGVAVDLVLASPHGSYRAEVPRRVRVVDLHRGRVATSFPLLVGYLRRRRPRSLLSTLEHANVVALLARRFVPDLRVVVREANTIAAERQADVGLGRTMLWWMRRTYPTADGVVAVSEGVAADLVREVGVPYEKVHIIYNPVLTARVWAGAREPIEHPWFAPGEPPVILGVGRLAPQKRFDTLIRAFARARRRVACRLVLLGEGESRDELEALARELGVSDAVALPGFVSNPFAFMARAGAFVLSSSHEGLPNVLIQALALGTPVVSTDCPSGPNEILDGGRWGTLVAVGDVDGMSDAVVQAVGRNRRPPQAEWVERYEPRAVAQQYLHVLGLAS